MKLEADCYVPYFISGEVLAALRSIAVRKSEEESKQWR
jgi:hypothetical protein